MATAGAPVFGAIGRARPRARRMRMPCIASFGGATFASDTPAARVDGPGLPEVRLDALRHLFGTDPTRAQAVCPAYDLAELRALRQLNEQGDELRNALRLEIALIRLPLVASATFGCLRCFSRAP